MDYISLPPENPKIEIKTNSVDITDKLPPTADSSKEVGFSLEKLNMILNEVSVVPDWNTEKLSRIINLVKERDLSEIDISNFTKAELLNHLMKLKEAKYGSVIPKISNSQINQFKVDSKNTASQVIVNDYRHGGAAQIQNFNTTRSAGHVLNSQPESAVSYLSKIEIRKSIDPDFPEDVQIITNDPRFTDKDNNMVKMRGSVSEKADFALAGNSLDSIRMEAASQLSNPDLPTDQEYLDIIKREGVNNAVLYNSRNFITGENSLRPGIMEIYIIPIYTDQLDYTGANLTKEQKTQYYKKGGIIYLSVADINAAGIGTSGSVFNIQTKRGRNIEGNHSGGLRLSAEQAKVIEQNNPEFSNQIKAFFLRITGKSISLEEAIKNGLFMNDREIGEQNKGKVFGSIGVVKTKERYQEILEITNPVPKTLFQQPK